MSLATPLITLLIITAPIKCLPGKYTRLIVFNRDCSGNCVQYVSYRREIEETVSTISSLLLLYERKLL